MTVYSSAAVRTLWQDSIFEHVSVLAVTDSVYDYHIEPTSQAELDKLYYNKEINYIEYIIARTRTPGLCGAVQYRYDVDITITRKADAEGVNFNKVIDLAETILDLIASELESDWTGYVDYYETEESPPVVEYITVADVPCYRTSFKITGFKQE